MRHLVLLAAALVGVLTAARPAAATCMRLEIKPQLLTLRDTCVPADGGIVVGYGYTSSADEVEKTRSADPSDVAWTARDAKKQPVTLTRTMLAPGLSVLRPAADASAFSLFGKKGKQLAVFTHDGTLVSMTAPQAKGVVSKHDVNPRWSSTTATLTLAAAAPPEAMAIIAYASGTPVNFTRLADTHDKDLQIAVYSEGGHCGTEFPAGTSFVGATGKVTFAYVDAFGRLSPQSKPVTVKRAAR
jgi:hypothetical protein